MMEIGYKTVDNAIVTLLASTQIKVGKAEMILVNAIIFASGTKDQHAVVRKKVIGIASVAPSENVCGCSIPIGFFILEVVIIECGSHPSVVAKEYIAVFQRIFENLVAPEVMHLENRVVINIVFRLFIAAGQCIGVFIEPVHIGEAPPQFFIPFAASHHVSVVFNQQAGTAYQFQGVLGVDFGLQYVKIVVENNSP